MEWCHNALYHPGETSIEFSIAQHSNWKSPCYTMHKVWPKCKASEKNKQYDKQLRKEIESKSWDVLFIMPYIEQGASFYL